MNNRSKKWLVGLGFLAMSLSASTVLGQRATVVTKPTGHLFISAFDATLPPVPGVGISIGVYEVRLPDGNTKPRFPEFSRVASLTWDRRNQSLTFNNREEPNVGMYVAKPSQTTSPKPLSLPTSLVALFGTSFKPADNTDKGSHVLYRTHVAVSPDGSRAAGLDVNNRLCVAAIAGDDVPSCVDEVPGCRTMAPTWSPDGKEIAFVGALKSNIAACNLFEVFVLNVATGVVRQLTDIPGDALTTEQKQTILKPGDTTDRMHKTGNPAWSPDGKWVAFGTARGIGRVHPDGTGFQMIAAGAVPAWSPDGSMIAYLVPRANPSHEPRYGWDAWNLFISRADGSNPVQVPLTPNSNLSVQSVVWVN